MPRKRVRSGTGRRASPGRGRRRHPPRKITSHSLVRQAAVGLPLVARHLTLVPAPDLSPDRRARRPGRHARRSPSSPPVRPPRSPPPARCWPPTSRSSPAPTSSSSPPARPAADGRCCCPPTRSPPRPRPPTTGSAAPAPGCSPCPVSAIAGLQVLCRSILAGQPATVLARDEPLARRGRPHARRPPVHGAGAHPAAPVPRRRARRAARLRRRPRRRRGHRPGAAGPRARRGRRRRDHLRHDRDRRRLRVRRPAAGRRPRRGSPTAAWSWPARCWRSATGCDPVATAEAFADGWFRTRDAGSPRRTAGSP